MAEKTQIDKDQIRIHSMSSIDDVGQLFTWEGRLFRAINNDAIPYVNRLMSSGLIKSLVDEELFPETWESNIRLPSRHLILEHARIPAVTYPYEWSFSMLQDAALALIKANEIASNFGFQIKDGHAYNILFNGSQAMFVDLGSFVPLVGDRIWHAYDQCERAFYFPLKIWADGNEFIARQILSGSNLLSRKDYWMYKSPIVRQLPSNHVSRIDRLVTKSIMRSPSQIREYFSGVMGKILANIREKNPWRPHQKDLGILAKKIKKIHLSKQKTQWGNYHDQMIDDKQQINVPKRFQRISELISDHQIQTIVEVAGNEGVFSQFLLSQSSVMHAICTDYDSLTIERLYKRIKNQNVAITPAILDLVRPLAGTVHMETPAERFQSDAVLALAVTHHLILSQHIKIKEILKILLSYTKKYIFVEFMPLGLYNGHISLPFPEWYSVEWFREACKNHFDVIHEEQLEANRILFVGKKYQS